MREFIILLSTSSERALINVHKRNAAMGRKIKLLAWAAFVACLLVFFKGCIPLLGWRMSFDDGRVEQISGYHKGERFRLNQDVFVVRSSAYGLGMLGVALPGCCRSRIRQGSLYSVPETIEEWKPSIRNDGNAGMQVFARDCVCGTPIVGVLPQGTELLIVGRKVVYAISWWYGFEKDYCIMASCMMDGKRIELEISDLTNWGTNAPFEEFLSRIPASGFEDCSAAAVQKGAVDSEAFLLGEKADSVNASILCVCGKDPRTADRYEARSRALRSISRRRDLSQKDVSALMAYVSATDGVLRVEREAALKNDVLNLLRNQQPIPDSLAELLVTIVERKRHAPEIIDYCIQHLGVLSPDVHDELMLGRIRRALVSAASDVLKPYAGTALYALAEDVGTDRTRDAELRQLTLAACVPSVHPHVRMSALMFAGERGYREILPFARNILDGNQRDAVLDTVAIGPVGCLGDLTDIPRLESLKSRGGRRLQLPIEKALQRIKGRMSKEVE